MLPLLLVPVLLGLSMLAQRPISRLLKVSGPVWPLLPFAAEVRWSDRLAVRGAGVLFTFLLVLGGLFLQARREQRLTPRVNVAPGLAAAEAGILSGDLITAIDGVEVSDFAAIRDEVLQGAPTKRVSLRREGRALDLTVAVRDGLLGVTAAGEERHATATEALQLSIKRLVASPQLLARALAQSITAPPSGSAGPGSAGWALSLSVALMFSWWLMLAVELGALALGAGLQSRR